MPKRWRCVGAKQVNPVEKSVGNLLLDDVLTPISYQFPLGIRILKMCSPTATLHAAQDELLRRYHDDVLIKLFTTKFQVGCIYLHSKQDQEDFSAVTGVLVDNVMKNTAARRACIFRFI